MTYWVCLRNARPDLLAYIAKPGSKAPAGRLFDNRTTLRSPVNFLHRKERRWKYLLQFVEEVLQIFTRQYGKDKIFMSIGPDGVYMRVPEVFTPKMLN